MTRALRGQARRRTRHQQASPCATESSTPAATTCDSSSDAPCSSDGEAPPAKRTPHYVSVRREIQALRKEADRLEATLQETKRKWMGQSADSVVWVDAQQGRLWKRLASTESVMRKSALDENARLKAMLHDKMATKQALERKVRLFNQQNEVRRHCNRMTRPLTTDRVCYSFSYAQEKRVNAGFSHSPMGMAMPSHWMLTRAHETYMQTDWMLAHIRATHGGMVDQDQATHAFVGSLSGRGFDVHALHSRVVPFSPKDMVDGLWKFVHLVFTRQATADQLALPYDFIGPDCALTVDKSTVKVSTLTLVFG